MGMAYGSDKHGKYLSPTTSQYALTESRLKKMLKDAFIAGYESPVEFMQQEVDRILREPIEEAQKRAKELASEVPSAKKKVKVKGSGKFLDPGEMVRKIESSYDGAVQNKAREGCRITLA